MFSFSKTELHASSVRSLVWDRDELVDWASGGRRFRLDGSVIERRVNIAYPFDAAIQGPEGLACIYTRLGTKALLLRDGKLVRELNRSYYYADAYEYPVALVAGPDGRTLVVHCPDAYDRLEIDDALTGERLTRSDARAPKDFFHSRLAANPSSTRLLSAGWVWHPWDAVSFYDLAEALRDPRHLDEVHGLPHSAHFGLAEESSAAWLSDDRVVIGGSSEPEDPEEVAELGDTPRLRSNGLAVLSAPDGRCLSSAVLGHPPGTMMAVGEAHVICFFEHPRLVELATGSVLREWPELPSGRQTSSITRGLAATQPPLALDPAGRRFAIHHGESITVVELG